MFLAVSAATCSGVRAKCFCRAANWLCWVQGVEGGDALLFRGVVLPLGAIGDELFQDVMELLLRLISLFTHDVKTPNRRWGFRCPLGDQSFFRVVRVVWCASFLAARRSTDGDHASGQRG